MRRQSIQVQVRICEVVHAAQHVKRPREHRREQSVPSLMGHYTKELKHSSIFLTLSALLPTMGNVTKYKLKYL